MLTQSGMFPLAYVYPKQKRALRDLLRRKLYFAEERADMFCHIQLLNHQVNNPNLGRLSRCTYKHKNISTRFDDIRLQKSVNANLTLIGRYDTVIRDMEIHILQHTRKHCRGELNILQSIHGIGDIIALTILYEIDTIERFNRVQELISYSRLIKCTHTSAGKPCGSGGKKIGNPHLKRAFSEAAVFVIKFNPQIKKYFEKLAGKKGKAKAYAIIARKLGQAVYFMLKQNTAFDINRFLAH